MTSLRWDDAAFKVSGDTPWQARLRDLQSWYRENVLKLPAGMDANQTLRGNQLPGDAPFGSNFIAPEIARFAEDWLPRAKEAGALVQEDRLWRNMLSSMPLAFNLFVPFRANLDAASEVFGRLSDGRIARITEIQFEFSPGRGDPRFTADGTAFDVFVSFVGRSGTKGFLGIEVKYHEDLQGDSAEKRPRYLQLARDMGCFREGALDTLANPPLGQLWRNHLLAGSLLIEGQFDDGLAVLVCPRINAACSEAEREYRACLSDDTTFDSWPIEQIVQAATKVSKAGWVEAFTQRYLEVAVAS